MTIQKAITLIPDEELRKMFYTFLDKHKLLDHEVITCYQNMGGIIYIEPFTAIVKNNRTTLSPVPSYHVSGGYHGPNQELMCLYGLMSILLDTK
jgi:hypothetical protein